MPAFGRDAGRALAPLPRRRRLHLARSLLATPWFAAGAGIVIAAVLAVDSPTALTYGPPERCPVHGCGSSPRHSPGQPATAPPSVALRAPGLEMNGGGTARGRPHGGAARGRLIGYRIIRRWSSGFLELIALPRATTPGGWSLRFAFAAAHVDRVWGARWQPSGNGDGGTADGPLQPPGHSTGADQILVSATGTPEPPSGCELDGVSCRFSWDPGVGG